MLLHGSVFSFSVSRYAVVLALLACVSAAGCSASVAPSDGDGGGNTNGPAGTAGVGGGRIEDAGAQPVGQTKPNLDASAFDTDAVQESDSKEHDCLSGFTDPQSGRCAPCAIVRAGMVKLSRDAVLVKLDVKMRGQPLPKALITLHGDNGNVLTNVPPGEYLVVPGKYEVRYNPPLNDDRAPQNGNYLLGIAQITKPAVFAYDLNPVPVELRVSTNGIDGTPIISLIDDTGGGFSLGGVFASFARTLLLLPGTYRVITNSSDPDDSVPRIIVPTSLPSGTTAFAVDLKIPFDEIRLVPTFDDIPFTYLSADMIFLRPHKRPTPLYVNKIRDGALAFRVPHGLYDVIYRPSVSLLNDKVVMAPPLPDNISAVIAEGLDSSLKMPFPVKVKTVHIKAKPAAAYNTGSLAFVGDASLGLVRVTRQPSVTSLYDARVIAGTYTIRYSLADFQTPEWLHTGDDPIETRSFLADTETEIAAHVVPVDIKLLHNGGPLPADSTIFLGPSELASRDYPWQRWKTSSDTLSAQVFAGPHTIWYVPGRLRDQAYIRVLQFDALPNTSKQIEHNLVLKNVVVELEIGGKPVAGNADVQGDGFVVNWSVGGFPSQRNLWLPPGTFVVTTPGTRLGCFVVPN
jgi:hypothetical protein